MSRTAFLGRTAAVTLAVVGAAMVMWTVSAYAFEPFKWKLESHWGLEVDKTTGGKICTVISKDECQLGVGGHEAGAFFYPESLAVASNGHVYVADKINHRIQEFAPDGKFILTFGWKVNKNGANVCTETEAQECGAGATGTGEAEQLLYPQDIAIDQQSGRVLVLDVGYHRLDEYTETGEFVLMAGREVNRTKAEAIKAKGGTPSKQELEEENLCTEEEIKQAGVECQAGKLNQVGETVRGGFKTRQFRGSLLAIGPEDHVVYVGDEGRVQEFSLSGKWLDEIELSNFVEALAAGPNGKLFVSVEGEPGIHEFKAGVPQSCVIDPSSTSVEGLAVDAYGRLGVLDGEPLRNEVPHGVLYQTSDQACGAVVAGSEFGPFVGELPTGLAFQTSEPSDPLADRMYVPQEGFTERPQEILAYQPIVFPEAKTCPAINVGATSASLCGEINPNSIKTRGFFRYGTEKGKLDHETLTAFEGEGETVERFYSPVAGLVPNQEYWYAVFAEAEIEAGKPEQASGGELSFHTTTPPPEIPGEPNAAFVTGQTAVLEARINPEHAHTLYHFEYGPCEELAGCASVLSTPDQESSLYGLIGVTQEALGLLPGTRYSFRLVADNSFERGAETEGGSAAGEAEGHFTTAQAPKPQATTGPANEVTSTTAVITGEVNPDGKPATYRFELAVYSGISTHYATILSGSAGSDTASAGEIAQLADLQPDTTYAYKIVIESPGYGSAEGSPMLFHTQPLPTSLPEPPVILMLPAVHPKFPHEPCKQGLVLNKHGHCVKHHNKKRRHHRHKHHR